MRLNYCIRNLNLHKNRDTVVFCLINLYIALFSIDLWHLFAFTFVPIHFILEANMFYNNKIQ